MAAVVVTIAAGCIAQQEISTLERRAQELNKAIMCPVCPGESIDQSQNDLAASMRNIVFEQLEQGWSEGQVKQFFVDRYGPSVLMEPPRAGFSLVVWVLPPVGVVAAALALFLTLRVMRRSQIGRTEGTGATVQASDPELADYYRRIEAALGYAEVEHMVTEGMEGRAASSEPGGSQAEGGD